MFSLVQILAVLAPAAGLLAQAPGDLPKEPQDQPDLEVKTKNIEVKKASIFAAVDVDQSRFVIVAAPIGAGEYAQLNIYEQKRDSRPCFAVVPPGKSVNVTSPDSPSTEAVDGQIALPPTSAEVSSVSGTGAKPPIEKEVAPAEAPSSAYNLEQETGAMGPVKVDPLLSSFDFTGICSRYIDGNGYSLRVGEEDLASTYRISVVREKGDNVLMAFPSKPSAGPEMVIARSVGHSQNTDYLLLQPEPGWKLMRRQFGGRNLGHVYIYRDSWPAAAQPAPEAPVPGLW